MKAFKVIMKILAALAFVAGIVYVVAKYGERIVAWARQLMYRVCDFFGIECSCCCDCNCDCDCDCENCDCEGDCDDCDCDCECDCGCTAEEVTEETVVAEEADFEG